MSALSWSQAAFWLCIGALVMMLASQIRLRRKRRNRRLGLPSPLCQRVPDEMRVAVTNCKLH